MLCNSHSVSEIHVSDASGTGSRFIPTQPSSANFKRLYSLLRIWDCGRMIPQIHEAQSSTLNPGGITKEGLSFLSSDRISSVHFSYLSIMLWHMDTWSSKPCPYLLSHLLVFNDSLAIPTSYFFLFSTYSIMAG